MRLVTYQNKDESRPGFLLHNRIVDLRDAYNLWFDQDNLSHEIQIREDCFKTDWLNVLQAGAYIWDIVKSVYHFIETEFNNINQLAPVSIEFEHSLLLPPVRRPGKIICVGLNYPPADGDGGSKPPFPVLFHKASSALTGHQGNIVIPKISNRVEYEGELAIIIGTFGKNLSLDEAMSCIAGYSIANDLGASDIQARSSQWASGKMFDTFCPFGPAIITLDKIPDPDNLHLLTLLNGEIVQDGWTGDMYYPVVELISYISSLASLEPGDLILTGSPKCVGKKPDPRLALKPGDTIQVQISGLGSLLNHVVLEEP